MPLFFMIKLIASDMDGTLLNQQKQLPPDFFPVLNQLQKRGIRFVASSGRSYVTLYKNFQPYADQLDYICDNGAFVVVNGQVVAIEVIPHHLLRMFIEFCNQNLPHIRLVLCGVKGTYHQAVEPEFDKNIAMYYVNHQIVDDLADVSDDIFKIAICDLTGPENGSQQKLFSAFNAVFDIPVSGPVWMDVMNKGINKGAALARLQHQLQITPAETMAFGDFYNDVELLAQAEYSFVMENAHSEMFGYGKYRAESNENFGVTRAIQKFVLDGEIPQPAI